MERANIGGKLKELRLERGLTMDMLVADLKFKYQIEINKSQLSRWENNENDPSLQAAAVLSDYYNVSVDYLLGITSVRVPSRLWAYIQNAKEK